MSTFNLPSLDEIYLKQIVKKFNSVKTGSRFMRSSKQARDLAEWIKPAWPLPRIQLDYIRDEKNSKIENSDCPWPRIPLQYCRIESIALSGCSSAFLTTDVLPEVGAMGAVTNFLMIGEEQECPQKLAVLAAANPRCVALSGNYDLTCPILKNIPELYVMRMESEYKSYWESTRIFEIMRPRELIFMTFDKFYKQLISTFIQNWLKGESTGSLSYLTYYMEEELRKEDMDAVLNSAEIQSIVKKFARGEITRWLEREGGEVLRIEVLSYRLIFSFFLIGDFLNLSI